MMTPTLEISEHFSPMSPDQIVLESSVLNAEALWQAFAVARGHRIIDEPDWLAVDSGEDIGGTACGTANTCQPTVLPTPTIARTRSCCTAR